MLTDEQRQKYLAKWADERVHQEEIIARIGKASARNDREAVRLLALDLLAYGQSLYPCEHGRQYWQDCPACADIRREILGRQPDDGVGGPIG